jgi:archaellum component FlaC
MDSNTNTGNGQRIKVAEFQGYTMAKLEVIGDEMKEMKDAIKEISKCVQSNRGKILGLAGTISLVVTLVVMLLKSLLFG